MTSSRWARVDREAQYGPVSRRVLDNGCLNARYYGAYASSAVDRTANIAANDMAIAAMLVDMESSGRGGHFPRDENNSSAIYNYSTTIIVDWSGGFLSGDKSVELKFWGDGVAVMFDGGESGVVLDDGLLLECGLRELIINGTSDCTIAIHWRSVHQGWIERVRVENCTTAALKLETSSSNDVNVACTVNRRMFATLPTYGVHLAKRAADAAGFTSTMNVFRNCYFEGLASGTGIYAEDASDNTFQGGASEGNSGGVTLEADGLSNRFDKLTMASNTTRDIDCAGSFNEWTGVLSQQDSRFTGSARGNVLRGGIWYADINNESLYAQRFDGIDMVSTARLKDRRGSPLLAWFSSLAVWGTAVATGTITCVAKASLADSDYITIGDGIATAVLYEFDTAGDGVTGGRVQVDVSAATTAASVATILAAAITANQDRLDAVDNGDGTLTLRHKIPGTHGNVSITENVANAGFSVSGMSGGA